MVQHCVAGGRSVEHRLCEQVDLKMNFPASDSRQVNAAFAFVELVRVHGGELTERSPQVLLTTACGRGEFADQLGDVPPRSEEGNWAWLTICIEIHGSKS